MKRLIPTAMAVACGAVLALGPRPSHAVNWLMLQGTEPPQADVINIWGFIQPEF